MSKLVEEAPEPIYWFHIEEVEPARRSQVKINPIWMPRRMDAQSRYPNSGQRWNLCSHIGIACIQEQVNLRGSIQAYLDLVQYFPDSRQRLLEFSLVLAAITQMGCSSAAS